MKNLHLLPTDKPSRLWINPIDGKLVFDKYPYSLHSQNIYITSDEKPKQNDWCLSGDVVHLMRNHMITRPKYNAKKIVLTTDSNLIENGVQEIDDEFLQWFVKNPTCELIKVVSENYTKHYFSDVWYTRYQTVIPDENTLVVKEESDYEILPEFSLSQDVFDKISSYDLSPELQQLVNDNWDYLIGAEDIKKQILYTEDEVRELIIKALTHNDHNLCGSLVTKDGEIRTANFGVWFEEFKKK